MSTPTSIMYRGAKYVLAATGYPPEVAPIMRLLSLMKIRKFTDGWVGTARFSEKKHGQQAKMHANWIKVQDILKAKPWKVVKGTSSGWDGQTETGGNYVANETLYKSTGGTTVKISYSSSFKTGTKEWRIVIVAPEKAGK